MHFWRTAAGSEVDLLIEHEGKLIPVEVKSTSTPTPEAADGIGKLRHDLGDLIGPGFVIHPGRVEIPLGRDTLALPFAKL
jgi:predicted AAA+ superfamily ATPase